MQIPQYYTIMLHYQFLGSLLKKIIDDMTAKHLRILLPT